MKGLLIKEFTLFRRSGYFIAVLVFAVMSIVSVLIDVPNIGFSAGLGICVIMSTIGTKNLAADSNSGWDSLEKALPYGKFQTVSAKYTVNLFGMLLSVVFTSLCFFGMGVSGNAHHAEDVLECLMGVSSFLPYPLLICQSVVLPMHYAFGRTVSRIIAVIIYIFGMPFHFVYWLWYVLGSDLSKNSFGKLTESFLVYTAVTAAVYAVSFVISCVIYEKRGIKEG